MKKLKFNDIFYIFIICSVLGWVIEGIWTLVKKGVLINHSALVIGPFNLIYGVSAVLLSLVLCDAKNKPAWQIFLISLVSCTIVEYFMSVFTEMYLGFKTWDYSKKFLNINGRVSLMYSLFWGILGLLWVKYFYPFIMKIIRKIEAQTGYILIGIIIIFLLIDTIITFNAIERAKLCDKGLPPQNNYEKFLDKHFNSSYLRNMFNDNWLN